MSVQEQHAPTLFVISVGSFDTYYLHVEGKNYLMQGELLPFADEAISAALNNGGSYKGGSYQINMLSTTDAQYKLILSRCLNVRSLEESIGLTFHFFTYREDGKLSDQGYMPAGFIRSMIFTVIEGELIRNNEVNYVFGKKTGKLSPVADIRTMETEMWELIKTGVSSLSAASPEIRFYNSASSMVVTY